MNKMEEVPLNVSSDEEESPQSTPKKTSNLVKIWKKKCTLKTLAELDSYSKSGMWGRKYSNNSEEGKKVYYRCTYSSSRKHTCLASMYALFAAECEDIVIYKCDIDHDHTVLKKEVGIPTAVKNEIKFLFNLGLKPKAILENLSKKQMGLPGKTQLSNYLKILKDEKFGPATISLGQLSKWLQGKSLVPNDENEGFVINYEVGFDDEEGDNYFRFFISSKKLLETASQSKILHADGTYKLVWQGFPVLVVGTTDLNRKFHYLGIAVTQGETKTDYKFLFSAINIGMDKCGLPVYKPDVLVCDAAGAIQNGYKQVFSSFNIVMCWAHMRDNTRKFVEKSVLEIQKRSEIMKDIDLLQLSPTKEIFAKALKF